MELVSAVQNDVQRIGRIGSVPKILQAAARTTGLRFAAIARVTDERWTACAVYDDLEFGLRPGEDLALESTLCNEIRQHRQPIVIDEVSTDPIYCEHHTPKRYGFQSYISIPIVLENGDFFGTLCALDPLPAKVSDPHVVASLELFAQLIAAEINREDQMRTMNIALKDAEELGTLREQLLAVMGHDLRNPLHSITFSAEALWISELNPKQHRMVAGIQRSCNRMSELITNILDLARGSISDDASNATRHPASVMHSELSQVVDEVRNAHDDVAIHFVFDLEQDVECDRRRIAQLLGNLLSNAVNHGSRERPVRVEVKSSGEHFEMSVENSGKRMTPETIRLLFQPFRRGYVESGAEGLGLGLFICSEISRLQGGEIAVQSSEGGMTRFTFRMPLLRASVS